MQFNDFDLDKYLEVDFITLEEERNTSISVSDYLAKNEPVETLIDSNTNYTILDINDFDIENYDYFPNIKTDQIITILKSQQLSHPFPGIPFPKIRDLDLLFSLYKHLVLHTETNHVSFKNNNHDIHSDSDFVAAAEYYGIINFSGYINNNKVYSIENEINTFNLDELYLHFLSIIGRCKVTRNALIVQLNMGTFDYISRNMVLSELNDNPNVIEQALTLADKRHLVTQMRYWYLTIRRNIIL